ALDGFAGELVGEQADARLVAGGGRPDDADEVVEMGEGEEVCLEALGELLGLAKLEAGPTEDDLAAVLDVAVEDLLEIEGLGAPPVDREEMDAEGGLELRE